MKCESCQTEIPPAWVAAIKSGICPGCGESLFTEETKLLMEELATAMASMPNNPQGLAGWLISNYNLRKIGDAKPVDKFHDKSNRKEAIGEKKAKNPVETLLARTGAARAIQETKAKAGGGGASKLAQMARNIASIDQEDQMLEQQDARGEIEIDDDEEFIEERGPRLSRNLLEGSTFINDPNAKPLTPDQLEALSQMGNDDSHIEDSHALLRAARMKRVEAQNELMTGGSVGIIKRSG